MDIDCILKFTQIGFYITGGTIVVLTYLKAKKGLLNTIYTEYQKKALLKVEEISNYLISEFDMESDFHCSKQMIIEDCVKEMLENFKKNKEILLKEKRWTGGIPGNPIIRRLENWVNKVKSDPFIPKAIRNIVVDYLEDRVHKMFAIHQAELRNFGDSLIKEPEKYEGKENIGAAIHNKIDKSLYNCECGISQVEEKIHELRLEIQKYYEKYDPFN